MDDFVQDIYEQIEKLEEELDQINQEGLVKLRSILWGAAVAQELATTATTTDNVKEQTTATPQQVQKRAKRLPSLHEDEDEQDVISRTLSSANARTSNSQLLAAANGVITEAIDSFDRKIMDIGGVVAVASEPTMEQSKLLMPPPALPVVAAISAPANIPDTTTARPQRVAKLNSAKNLKEPNLSSKLRRPTDMDASVKLEHEQRASQMHEALKVPRVNKKASIASTRSEDTIIILPEKTPSVIDILSDDERALGENDNQKQNQKKSVIGTGRQLRIKVKREKPSLDTEQRKDSVDSPDSNALTEQPTFAIPMPKQVSIKMENQSDESTLTSSTLSVTTQPATKKGRKKKKSAVPKPIKVERFSEIEMIPTPVSSRTRISQKQAERAASIYEDAVENLPPVEPPVIPMDEHVETPPQRVSQVPAVLAIAAVINETVTVSTSAKAANATMVLGDATFQAEQNPNATVTLAKKSGAEMIDATFDVTSAAAITNKENSYASTKHSMETARDTLQPQDDSLITEDEPIEENDAKKNLKLSNTKMPVKPTPSVLAKKTSTAKPYKMGTRTNELFNPLVQSPVKKKVEAFENAAQIANVELTKTGRPKRTKENAGPLSKLLGNSSNITPQAGKPHVPVLGRFLTPTQTSNITPNVTAKKAPNSASKVMAFPKTTTTKTLSRENSAEDFRKGLHQMAEERKKQREQKHLLAAQQREAKERERAERMAKVAKEREEKRLKKQMEAEQKKRELEEIQRKLRQQEATVAAQKAAKTKAITDQERELLMQEKQQATGSFAKGHMLPPPPKLNTKYTFEMLHEDDSTDDEGKTSYKRPPPPTWSRSHVRGAAILMQQHFPTSIIDSFFSVQPTTPDLKLIFPNIDARHLKRNSSAMWSTPPRYSELPKH